MTQPSPNPQTAFIAQMKKLVQDTLLSWGVPGAGLGLTMHFGLQGNWGGAIASLTGTAVLSFLLKFFTKLDSRLDVLAEWIVSQFEQSVLRLWWSATGNFQGKYYQSLIYQLRDFRVQGLKTKGPFALDLQKVFVPLRVSPESADCVPSALIQTLNQTGEGGKLEIWNFLAALPQQSSFRHMVILGPPGSGKSTLLEHLTLTYAQNRPAQNRHSNNLGYRAPRLIPVLLYLRDVQAAIATNPPPTLATLMDQQESLSCQR